MGNALKGLKSGISKGSDPLKNKIMDKLRMFAFSLNSAHFKTTV